MKKIITILLSLLMIIGSAAAVYAAVPADGTYSVAVSKEGGTGRVSVVSPCTVTVQGSSISARVVWTSSNYTWMRVAGVTYYNENSGGNSTFTIPVSAFDTPISVSAETTAMSEPHIIDYTLTFSSSGVSMKEESGQTNASQSNTSSSSTGKNDSSSNTDDKKIKDENKSKDDKVKVDTEKSISIQNNISKSTSASAQMLSKYKGKIMDLSTSNGRIIFDEKALAHIANKASGSITLTMDDVSENKEYKDDYDLVMALSLKDESSKELFERGNGKAKVILNFDQEVKNKKNIKVYKLTGDKAEEVDCSYDEKSKTVTFETDSLSVYAISQKSSINLTVIGVIAIIVIAAIGFFLFLNKKRNRK